MDISTLITKSLAQVLLVILSRLVMWCVHSLSRLFDVCLLHNENFIQQTKRKSNYF